MGGNVLTKQQTFFLMNSDHMKDLDAAWRFLLEPALLDVFSSLHSTIVDDVNLKRMIYIVLFTCFILLIILLYLSIIIPHQLETHKSVYDTKNILSIIPIEVVAGLKNIQKILNIKVSEGN